MRSPYQFIVSPLGGKYVTTKQVGDKTIYTTASIEDAKYVNRLAVVVNTPIHYDGNIKKGDLIVIHHNIFRDYYNTAGKVSMSQTRLFDDLYLLQRDLIYLYKSNDEWVANDDYCFIRPFTTTDALSGVVNEVKLEGIVVYSNDFEKDTRIGFSPESEYEFEIDGEILYRMRTKDICLTE